MPPKPKSSCCLLITTAPSAAARPAIRWAVSKSASSSVSISSSVVVLELSPTDGRRLLLIGGTVELGEAVEDVDYEVGEAESGPGCREPISEVDVGEFAGVFSCGLQWDEDDRSAMACLTQHAYDALHHALGDPVRKRRFERRPPSPECSSARLRAALWRCTSSSRSRRTRQAATRDSKRSTRDPKAFPFGVCRRARSPCTPLCSPARRRGRPAPAVAAPLPACRRRRPSAIECPS